ncbi:hypothetical protein L596_023377 [Steinernema carpocapsae]|uniref:Uncharacterized protein n=1 Tax=Steinernema carpocapsae TaxID=34508 RepID=A0A4U5MDI4_STECR|nr:hypothetical protein L596_023377 [Steinernema carpocapsae]
MLRTVMATADLLSVISEKKFLTGDVNLEDHVSDLPFTVGWLLKSLYARDEKFNKLSKNAKIDNITAYDISQGKGYFSKVYRTFIKFESLDKPYEVMLKVPGTESLNEDPANMDGEEMISIDFVEDARNLECDFYNLYARQLDIPLVKMYNVKKMKGEGEPGALLMESMVEGGESYPFHFSCTKEMALNIAKHMGTMYK